MEKSQLASLGVRGRRAVQPVRSRTRDGRLQLFKDVLERHGGFKIFRYYDEDPESVGAATHGNGQGQAGGKQ